MTEALQPGDIRAIARKPRVWDAELPVTSYVDGSLTDWPADMQDQVYAAMERLMTMTGVKELEIAEATCFRYESGIYVARVTIVEKLGPEDVVIVHG